MTSAASSDSLWRRIYYSRLRDVLRGRFDARLDWRQTIASAGLPSELASAVTQVVGKSRLWRSEKAAVATELVAHFQDGLEAGQSTEALLMSFGDTQAASQLIGRAKRRGRPVGWQIFHYGWMTTAGFALLYVMLSLWMATGRPIVRVNYLNEMNKMASSVPEKERAWPLYRDAFLSMGFTHRDPGTPVGDFLNSTAKPGDDNWHDKENFLIENVDSIDELREAASRPGLGFVSSTLKSDFSEQDRKLFGFKVTPEELKAEKAYAPENWLISMLLPDLQLLRDAGVLLAADANRAALAGDGDTAYDDIVAILGVSRHAQDSQVLVGVAVAEAIQNFARKTIREIMTDHPALWTDAQLHDIAHRLAGTEINWNRGFEGERACFLDSMQRIYTDNGSGDGRLALKVSKDQNLFQLLESIDAVHQDSAKASLFSNSGIAMLTLPAANFVVASRKDMIAEFEKVTTAAHARIMRPYWQQVGEPPLEEFGAEEQGPLGRFRYLFVRLLTPAYERLRDRIVYSNGEREGVYLGIALELYHRHNKAWPKNLEELSPQYLPQAPVDPITGKSLQYKIVNDRPLVYSVGMDGDDDGGRPAPDVEFTLPWIPQPATPPADGDWIIWTTAKSG